mgnify:CR=1 FL=1
MSFSVTSKIKLNLPVLKQLDTAQQTALRNTTDALLRQIKNSQVMPFDTGNLQNESTFADYANLAEGETKIVSSTPYARRLYFHPEYKFHRAVWVDKDGKNTVQTRMQAASGLHLGSRAVHDKTFVKRHLHDFTNRRQDFDLFI